jgi:hypothetical protein
MSSVSALLCYNCSGLIQDAYICRKFDVSSNAYRDTMIYNIINLFQCGVSIVATSSN